MQKRWEEFKTTQKIARKLGIFKSLLMKCSSVSSNVNTPQKWTVVFRKIFSQTVVLISSWKDLPPRMLVGICYQIFSCQISLKSDFWYIKLFRKYTYVRIRRYFAHRDFNFKYVYFCTCYNSYQRVFYLFV